MTIRKATSADNEALLALTQQTPMGGVIPLIIDRQPDFFGLQTWRGPGDILVVEHNGVIHATINRTRLRVWHRGEQWTADYLCDLKVLEAYRRGMTLPRLLRAVRELIESDPPDVVLCVVARGNDLAEATIRGRAGMPPFRFVDEFAVHQILPQRKPPAPSAWSIERNDGVPEEVAAFLNDRYRQMDIAPVVDPNDAVSRVSTTLTARGADGRLAAAMTLLNTHPVKQNMVVDLPWYLHLLRVSMNAIPPGLGLPRMPNIGEPIRILYVRLWAHEGQGAEAALHDLIAHARWEAHQQGCHFVSMAGTEDNAFAFKRYFNISFHSQLYAARHDDDRTVLDSLQAGSVFEDFSMV